MCDIIEGIIRELCTERITVNYVVCSQLGLIVSRTYDTRYCYFFENITKRTCTVW